MIDVMKYDIVFRGKLASGFDREQAMANLARLFKSDAARVAPLFSGKRVTIKKGVDRETGDKYRSALRKAGLMVALVRQAPPEPPQPAASQAPAASTNRAQFGIDDPTAKSEPPEPPQPSSSEAQEEHPAVTTAADDDASIVDDADLAPVGVQLVPQVKPEPPQIDITDLTLATVGVTVDETPRPPPATIDTSDLSATDEFDALDASPPPPPPEFDLDGLQVANDEGPVDQSPKAPPPDIDISELSASEIDSALDASPPPPPPKIDISHLDSSAT